MISINIEILKDEIEDLQRYMHEKLAVEIKIEGKLMDIGLVEDKLARGNVKDYLERFFYRKGLSEKYSIRTEKDVLKIIKRKS